VKAWYAAAAIAMIAGAVYALWKIDWEWSQELAPTLAMMIILGVLMLFAWASEHILEPFKKRKEKNMSEGVYKLFVPCPKCGKPHGVRLVVDESEFRVVCISCEEMDESVELDQVLETVSTLTLVAHDEGPLEEQKVQEVVADLLGLPEEEE